jgi:hypothetical protein
LACNCSNSLSGNPNSKRFGMTEFTVFFIILVSSPKAKS